MKRRSFVGSLLAMCVAPSVGAGATPHVIGIDFICDMNGNTVVSNVPENVMEWLVCKGYEIIDRRFDGNGKPLFQLKLINFFSDKT